MQKLIILGCAALSLLNACTTTSSTMISRETAIVSIHWNTSTETAIKELFRKCSEVTLRNGFRYFCFTSAMDTTTHRSVTIPGSAYTSLSATGGYGYMYDNAYTTYTPAQTITTTTPGVTMGISMSNDKNRLTSVYHVTAIDAAFYMSQFKN